MTRLTVVVIAALLALAGCSPSEKPDAPRPSTPSATAQPTSSSDLVIDYGQLGPAKSGMTEAQALATGLFRANAPAPVDGCPAPPLEWKKAFAGVDVYTAKGRVTSLGVMGKGPKTADGMRVGSTLLQVKNAYPDLVGPETAGYGQVGAWAKSGDRWIGFLFGEVTDKTITEDAAVTFIEVTRGSVRPDLIRDGC